MKNLLELSVSEIISELNNQQITIRKIDAEVRCVPQIVAKTAKQNLNNPEKVLRYIESAFYIYRASTNKELFAPHTLVEGAFEWPSPVKFSWGNVKAVILGGEALEGKIPNNKNGVTIETPEKEFTQVTEINPFGTAETYLRDFQEGRDNLNKVLKYSIDPEKLGFLFSTQWQNSSLQTYANPVYWELSNLVSKKITPEKAKKDLEMLLDFFASNFMKLD